MRGQPEPPASEMPLAAAMWLTVLAVGAGLALLVAAGGIWGAVNREGFDAGFRHAQTSVPLTSAMQLIAMGGVLRFGLGAFAHAGRYREALALRALPIAPIALYFVAGMALQFPLAELGNLLYANVFGPPSLEEQQQLARLLAPPSPWARLGVLLSLGLLVPLIEEILFRGHLLQSLRPRYGSSGAVVFSAMLFGVSHLKAVPVLYATVAGLLLGAIALRARSIWASVAVHAGVNCAPVILGADLLRVHGFNVPSQQAQHLPLWLSLGGAASCAALLAAAGRMARTARMARNGPDSHL